MFAPITTKRILLAGLPVLHCYPTGTTEPLPTVFYYHGWSSTKNLQTVVGEALAAKGFRAILPDAIMHGERGALPDYNTMAARAAFGQVIIQSVMEHDALYHAALEQGFILNGQVGVGGHSMGGMIAAGIMARYDWPKAAALLDGCPVYTWMDQQSRRQYGFPPATEAEIAPLKAVDPEYFIEHIAPRPFLMLHATGDPVVPVGGVRRFYELAQPAYREHPDRLVLQEYEWQHHAVPPHMVDEMRSWFVKHLG